MAFKYKSCLNVRLRVLMANCSVPQVQLVWAAMNAGTHKGRCGAPRRMRERKQRLESWIHFAHCFVYLPSQWTLQEWVPHLFFTFTCTKFHNTCWKTLQRKCHFVMSQRADTPTEWTPSRRSFWMSIFKCRWSGKVSVFLQESDLHLF